MFDALQDWLEEREMEKAYDEGVSDGANAVFTEELQANYDAGFAVGHGDLDEHDD